MRYLHTGITIAAAMLMCGCDGFLYKSYEEEGGVLSAGKTQMELPADTFFGTAVTDTMYITANKSWSAHVIKGDDWLTIGTEEHMNLNRISDVTAVALTADDNKGASARTAMIRISSRDGSVDVNVTQAAMSPRLQLLTPTEYDNLSSDGDSFPISIVSNTDWTASIDAASTASVSLSQTSGSGNAELLLTLGENPDFVSTKFAVIEFNAPGCPAITVEINQAKAIPYFRIEEGATEIELEPGRFNATVPIRTNTDWTATILESEGWKDATLGTAAGTRTSTEFKLRFTPAFCFGSQAHMSVRIDIAGGEPVTINFIQKPVIRLMFRDPKTSALVPSEEWPLLSPSKGASPTNAGEASNIDKDLEITHITGYKMKLHSKKGIWRVTASGFNIGGETGNYLTLPAVEGHRLVKVYYEHGQTGSFNLSIRKADFSATAAGGEAWETLAQGNTHTWTLTDTQPGTPYAFYIEDNGTMGIRDLILYYE